jgi:hypothetical protein
MTCFGKFDNKFLDAETSSAWRNQQTGMISKTSSWTWLVSLKKKIEW